MAIGRIGVIGGSGLGEALGTLGAPGADRSASRGEASAAKVERVHPKTPFGKPSAPITLTELDGVEVALLARHGEGHLLNPSQVPYRANLFALKQLGVTHVLASGAVGSLREEIAPGELVLTDQVIDKTYRRAGTFFDELAAHVELATPFCPTLRGLLERSAPAVDVTVHRAGTYVCMEGPQFSTRAESELHRSWGAQLIGMTLMPEAKLAREAELCYAPVNLVSDYDCWRPHPGELDQLELLKEILANLKAATANALALIRAAIPGVRGAEAVGRCGCQGALSLGIWSDRARIPDDVKERLWPLLEGPFSR